MDSGVISCLNKGAFDRRATEAQTKDGGPSTRTTCQTMARQPTGRNRRCQLCQRLRAPQRAAADRDEAQDGLRTPAESPTSAALVRRKQRPTHEKVNDRPPAVLISPRFVLTNVIPAEFFTRCCASHPPPASPGCCCSSFTVRAARKRPERAHKWDKGVSFHRSPSVIGWLVAHWC